jgi:hypothetical protein
VKTDLNITALSALSNIGIPKRRQHHPKEPFRPPKMCRARIRILLDDVHAEGRAGRLRDIHSGTLVKVKASGAKERVHLDDLKVFVPRIEMPTVNTVDLRDWVRPEGAGAILSFDLEA